MCHPDPAASCAATVPAAGTNTETIHPQAVKVAEAGAEMAAFLGSGPYSQTHPRLGTTDPTRIVSADGTRSIRYGDHERNSAATKHHYHEETWTLDTATNTMNVSNQVRRVPIQVPKSATDAAARVADGKATVAAAFDALKP
jgi:hypothetical protein